MFLDLGSNFPQVAPNARFITPILHPNISKQGRVCHSIIDRTHSSLIEIMIGNWTADTSIVDVLNSIWALLMVPDMDDAMYTQVCNITENFSSDPLLMAQFRDDREGYERDVREHATRQTMKTSQDWAIELARN